MLNLDHSAVIPANIQTALNQIPDGEKSGRWDSRANRVVRFKSEIMTQGLQMQGSRCVWCTLEVSEEGHRTAHRDHIAPKGTYGQWTFLPDNLAIACEYCNGFEVKGELDTVSVAGAEYSNSEFHIVHPYFDNTEDHIRFVDRDVGFPVVVEGLSDEGLWTIDKMRLDSTQLTKERAKDFLFARDTEALPNGYSDVLKKAVGRPTG